MFAADGSSPTRPTSQQAYERAAGFRTAHSAPPLVRPPVIQRSHATPVVPSHVPKRAGPQIEPIGTGADFRPGVWRPTQKRLDNDDDTATSKK